MTPWLLWLLISGSLVVAEIFTTTFYLLLAAIGALVASGLAATGFSDTIQIVGAALVTLIGWILMNKYRPQNLHPDSRSNPAINMDIGGEVRLLSMSADAKIHVMLRGARWEAKIENGDAPDMNATYIIDKIDGSTLILKQKI